MKTTVIITVSILAIILMACSNDKPKTTEVSVLIDVTEKTIDLPEAKQILNLYNFDANIENGGIFNFSTISNFSINKRVEFEIQPGSKALSNRYQRKKEVSRFQESVESVLSNNLRESQGQGNSTVYKSIASELNRLAESNASRKIAVISSDLMENNGTVSFYSGIDFSKLESKPDDVKNYFESIEPLNSLKGVQVLLIFQPKDLKSDQRFSVLSNFYKKLLQEKGASVQISSNI